MYIETMSVRIMVNSNDLQLPTLFIRPYHVACSADNDLAVTTVTKTNNIGGLVHHYNAQTKKWVSFKCTGSYLQFQINSFLQITF